MGSAIMIENSIFFVSGVQSPFEIERIDLKGDELINQEVIGYNTPNYIPVLFGVTGDYCV